MGRTIGLMEKRCYSCKRKLHKKLVYKSRSQSIETRRETWRERRRETRSSPRSVPKNRTCPHRQHPFNQTATAMKRSPTTQKEKQPRVRTYARQRKKEQRARRLTKSGETRTLRTTILSRRLSNRVCRVSRHTVRARSVRAECE